MRYLWILIPFLISIFISFLLEKLLGNGEKTDKGFLFFFWNLSYRRKFIRTLWLLPILVIAVFYIHITFQSYLLTSIIGIILSIIFIIQAVYYYKKQKEDE